MGKKYIGIDIGGTSVKLGLFEADGTLLDKWEVKTRKEENGVHILPDIAASIKDELAKKQIALSEIAGAGMGLPGPVMPDGSVEVCVNLGWHDLNPAQELSALLDGVPVKSGNDANVAALGEMWQGGGKGYSDIVMVTLGTGIGGGVILNQQIVTGKHGLAGEIGHLPVREDDPDFCNCGGQGCAEQTGSATGIAREARRMMAASEKPSVLRACGDAVTAKDVLDAAKAGDELALEILDVVCHYIGKLLGIVSLTVDPDVFVIGGGVSKAGQFLIDKLESHYQHFTPISKNKAGLALAKLGNDAGIYGAARLVLE